MFDLCPVCGKPIDPKQPCGCRESAALKVEEPSLELDNPPERHKSAAPPALGGPGPQRVAIASFRPPPMVETSRRSLPPEAGSRRGLVIGGVIVAVVMIALASRSFIASRFHAYVGDDAMSAWRGAPNGMVDTAGPDDFGYAANGPYVILPRKDHAGEEVFVWAPAAASNMGRIVSGPDTTTLDDATAKVGAAIAQQQSTTYQRGSSDGEACRPGAEESRGVSGSLGTGALIWTCAFRQDGVVYVAGYTVPIEQAPVDATRLRRIAGRTRARRLDGCAHFDHGWFCPP